MSVAGSIVPEILVELSVLVIVKLGYVPEILVAPAPVNVTVWSGEVFVNVVHDKLKPVPAVYVVSPVLE